MSKDEIVLEEGWDPDDFRDKLCEDAWKRSGAKTLKQFVAFRMEELRQYNLRRNQEEAQRKVAQ